MSAVPIGGNRDIFDRFVMLLCLKKKMPDMNVFIYLRYSSELLSYFEFITALFSLKIIIIGIGMEYMDFDSSLVWLNFYR